MAVIKHIPVLSDNYAYLLIDETTGVAAAVDCVEPVKVLEVAKEANVTISHILTTHKHWDHAGGNSEMVKKLGKEIKVLGGSADVQSVNQIVGSGDVITIGSIEVKVLASPCHTREHVLYYVEEAEAVFTGDTLFVAGCGKFFEGTAEEMHSALNSTIASLPVNTKIYCGHEYTVSNLRFAAHVEPQNKDISSKLEWSVAQRNQGQVTIPSTVASELETNPFMRVHVDEVRKFAQCENPVSVMAALREAKNKFVYKPNL